MLSDEIINYMKKNIVVDGVYEPQISANCFLYAINCDVSPYDITYVDDSGEYHYGNNLGEVSDSSKIPSTKEQTRTSFLKDCEVLGIKVKTVSEDYELIDENEWLVALYYTEPFFHHGKKTSDFHFIKKKFGEDIWIHKPPCDVVRKKDKTKTLITAPTSFVWYVMDDDRCRINYEYIDTYCLRRKKI